MAAGGLKTSIKRALDPRLQTPGNSAGPRDRGLLSLIKPPNTGQTTVKLPFCRASGKTPNWGRNRPYRKNDMLSTLANAGEFVSGGWNGLGAVAIDIADMNADGIPDVVVVNHYTNDVSVLLGNGDGSFAPALLFGTGQSPVAGVVGDFSHDGRLGIAVADTTGGFTMIKRP